MTITPWELYWLLKLDDIRKFIGFFGQVTTICTVLIVVFAIVAYGAYLSDDDEDALKAVRIARRTIYRLAPVCILLSLLNILLPSTTQMVAIKVVPAIVNSELVQEDIPAELKDLYFQSKEALFGIKPKEKDIQPREIE